ncbi:hypothetical protein DQ04_01771050 [Trypanosoma grayi]|uniref:hypothetical protein n=1 Tax=Trypanosoma grayi TaxID=71804 RepID=UPI0004F3F7DC|nr:hypothetical protein DQ04_01771050 [Trypanosoma grayi]KEG12357.1 hypothetical protein DQ04_01771050 [Trypanosoma grayi]
MSGYSTSMRMQQHRLNPSADIGVPENVSAELRGGAPIIREAAAGIASLTPKAAIVVCREVDGLIDATTPEQRVRCVSQITGALREAGFVAKRDAPECKLFLQKLASHFVFPLMLHCAVRYLHRALATLVRTVYVIDDELEVLFREAFLDTHIRCWIPGAMKRPTILGEAGALDNEETLLRLKDPAMSWVNCIDSTTTVAIPLFPRVFADTFLDVVPLLGDSLQWMVENARMRCRQAKAGSTSDGTLLGEDLAYVRYGIRVVTTYTHKFLYLLERALCEADTTRIIILQEDMCRLLSPALAMLSSSVLPKDVLNGAGLLVSSLLTLRTCSPWLLLEVCRHCGTPNPHTASASTDALPSALLVSQVRKLVQLVSSNDPKEEAMKHTETNDALESILRNFSDNGRFALMKGLLAHLSVPLHNNLDSLGVLLKPIVRLPEGNNSAASEGCVVVHDIIMPAAEAYCSALQAPDTRFMAIQTIDSVVRHISSVLSCIADILEPSSDGDAKKISKAAKKSLQWTERNEPLPESQRASLLASCAKTPKLVRTLNHATDIIMGMWDDSTQQVAGPLYDTYNEILAVHNALRRCALLAYPNFAAINTEKDDFDTSETLRRILSIPDERRGKYHALLGLLNIVPLPEFLSELTKHYSQNGEITTDVEGLCCFGRMLLSGAGNHKIGSIAGEVFAKAAGRIRKMVVANEANSEVLFMGGIIEPLIKSLLVPGYSSSPHLNDAARVSSIVAHMITPCLKNDEVYLPILLSQMMQMLEGDDGSPVANQSVVEIIHRARLVGRDVAAYTHPSSRSFKAILASLQAQESELRYTALGLCVLSTKKAEPVEIWQCRMVEWYISTNMHCGGDSAAMRSLLEVYKKWTRRLVDSYLNQNNKLKKGAEGSEAAEEYKQLVVEHCVRTVSCFVPQIGETAKWCRQLSLERRVAAMSAYTCLLRCVFEFIPAEQLQQIGEHLFPSTLVEGLLECLTEGWEKARNCAFSLLVLYCEHVPAVIFSSHYLGHLNAASSAKLELLRARTFRKAEGEVLRYVLAVHFTPAAKQAAAVDPTGECQRRVEIVLREMVLLKENFAELRGLGVKKACEFIQQHPQHGPLSLCTALLSNAWEVKSDAHILHEACNTLLLCCSEALQTCSLLGNESDSSSNNNTNNNGEVDVDCRGHVFDKDGSCTEETMRTVVNNTWLSIRTSAAAVERVMRLVKVEDLSFPVVREVCYVLIESLLRTKHNGVMRAVRQALKTVAAALLRSRDATFHTLPGEMLDFLLGPDGVTSGSVARMLRRSQGLPHAMLVILEAEDPNVPVYLFPKAMKTLLLVATGVNHNDAQSTVEPPSDETRCSQRSNALNVLKFVFENKVFATRSVAYLEEAFWIATAGFDAPSWGIRNSSLMLFSAVLPRFVGEHPSTGGVGVNTSLHDIAVRSPRGVAFSYEELVRSCANPVPSLGVFPLLQMLSMLTPDPAHLLTKATTTTAAAETEVAGADVDSSRIIRAVIRCGSSKNLMIRAASAVALTSLVPPAQIESLFSELLSKLADPQTDANTLHGTLLHMQQFHTFYVGTLRRKMRVRAMNSNATAAVAALVNRLTVEGLSDAIAVPMLHSACVRCPTIATTFLSLASDALYYNQSHGQGKNFAPLLELARVGVAVVHDVTCASTSSYEVARADHAAVEENSALLVLLVVQLLSLPSGEADDHIWNLLRRVFLSDSSACLLSYLMEHASYYTAQQRWSRETAERAMHQFTLQLHCDPTHAALHRLAQQLSEGFAVQELPCTGVLHMKAHLEYLVMLSSEEELRSVAHTELCDTVEELLLQRMSPQARRPLHNTDVQSWAIRFLARCCVRRGACSDAFVRVVSHYSRPIFNVQNRAAVVAALKDGLLSICEGNDKGGYGINNNTSSNRGDASERRCALLLILLRLLLDDAHDVRTDACRVVSHLTSTTHLSLDHMTCVLSVVCSLRRCGERGILRPEAVQHYLLAGEAPGDSITTDGSEKVDGDNETDDDESEDDEVLFEKEAENMFAEDTLLAYLVGAIARETKESGPAFSVYDELLRVAEQQGSATLLYAALVNGKQ